MFSINLLYKSILLIIYFDNHFDHTECSLLSRLKNPLNIVTDNHKSAEEQVVYFDLPGTLQRMIPTRRPQNIGRDSSHAASVMPEYVLDQNKPLRTSSPSINFFRYVAEKPSLEPDNYNYYESLKDYPSKHKIHDYEPKRTMMDMENDNYYEPLSPIARTTTGNRNQPLRTEAENYYQNQVSRTLSDLDKINRYEPLRTNIYPKIIGNYELKRTSTTLKNKNKNKILTKDFLQKNHMYQPLITLDNIHSYEPVISVPISENMNKDFPMRTITASENSDQYQLLRTLPVLNNDFKPVRTHRPPDSYYRHEPSRTSSFFHKTGHVNNILNFQLQQSNNRDELVRTHSTLDNIYRYEFERVSSPVIVYPYLPLRTSINEKSATDVYRFEPSRTSLSPEYLNQYKPIKFSALYIDTPTMDTNNLPNYIGRFENLGSLNESADEPVRTAPLPKFAYRLEPSRSSASYYFEPSRTSQALNTWKETYQFTPFLTYRKPEVTTKSKTKPQFTPFLKTEKFKSNIKQWESGNTTKSPDDYWNEFMQDVLESKQINQNKIEDLTPSLTTLNVYKNKERLKTLVVEGNLYHLLPFETSRAADDYWNEFIRNEHAKTYSIKKTVPVRTSQVRVPFRTAKLPHSPVTSFYEDGPFKTISLERNVDQNKPLKSAIPYDFFYQDIPVRTSRLAQTVHQYEPLTTSTASQTTHEYEPLRSSRSSQSILQYESLKTSSSSQAVLQYQPLRTSRTPQSVDQYEPLGIPRPSQSIHQYEPLRTSRSFHSVHQYEPLRTSRLAGDGYQNVPLKDYIYTSPDASSYKNIPTRSITPDYGIYQQGSLSTFTTEVDLNRNRPIRTSSPSQNFYLDEPFRVSKLSDDVYPTEVFRPMLPSQNVYHDETHDQPASPDTAYESNNISATDTYSVTRARQGFKTLWQPTPTTTINTKEATRIIAEENLKPTRTTRVVNWNFNDADAAWPKVELILSTTESTTAATTAKRKFATYFPFYLRTLKEESTDSSFLVETKAETTTALSNATKTDDLPGDDEIKKHYIAREGIEARCYSCGLNITMIPYFPSCYHIFEQPGSEHAIKRNNFRVHCKNRKKRKAQDYTIPDNRKLYRGGCFKRFIEFGDVYSERGCRTIEPILGRSFASYRLASMERVLSDVDEGCITSPHASLTPFARGVSLFARYHVCVCQGRYCNDAHMVTPSFIIALLNILLSI